MFWTRNHHFQPRLAGLLGGLLVAALLPAAPLCAQSPEDRAAIEAFRDSLEGIGDSVRLAAMEQRLIAVAKADRNNAIHHIRLGFLAVRMGDLGSKSRYDDGAGEFEWATDLQPTWPYGWYGLGIAEDKVGDSQISIVQGLQAMFGKDHLSRAANAYARSVQADPSFDRGLIELASTALRQRINIKTTIAREALRQAAATAAASNPEVLLWRGRLEREVGDIDSALAAFQGYLDHGGRRGLGLIELARTEFLKGSLDGQAPYYEGASIDDPVVVDQYRSDLALVANDSAIAEFNVNTGDRRVAFLHRFWGQRDRASLLKDGERLREHYRRIFYARKNFQLVSLNRHYDIVERFRSGSEDFDDRGVIYIRHGEPTDRARYNAPGMQLNESWHYTRADGDLIFHFVAREDVQDYKLVESLFDVLGFSSTVALRGDRDNNANAGLANELLLTREKFSPVYSKLLGAGTAGSQKYLTEERRIGRRSIAIGTTSDSYELTYARALKLETSVVAAGRDSAHSLLHVTYAIPGSALHEVPSDRGHLYPVRLRLSVADRVGIPVASVDTTTLFVAREPVPSNRYLVGRLAVPVIPGSLTYRLAVEQGEDNGIILAADTVSVGDFTGDRFELSGVVLGSRDANLTWRPAPGDTIYFNPLGRYQKTTTMEVYYEVYGLNQASSFKTEIRVFKEGKGGFLGIFGSKKPAIRLAFDEGAEGPVTRIHRSISLEKLDTGRYWLQVSVTDPQGAVRESQSSFEVRN
ncbi:MAG TPA: GWxTD domain-containing protein [Gemmatimonadales bacterium]|nr:GWxTD domain-containing protein [Gemmatimonadales bacterium]